MWSVEMYQVSNFQREEKKIIFKIDNASFCPVVKLPHFDGNCILTKLSLARFGKWNYIPYRREWLKIEQQQQKKCWQIL